MPAAAAARVEQAASGRLGALSQEPTLSRVPVIAPARVTCSRAAEKEKKTKKEIRKSYTWKFRLIKKGVAY
jgi:hypothetical protein